MVSDVSFKAVGIRYDEVLAFNEYISTNIRRGMTFLEIYEG